METTLGSTSIVSTAYDYTLFPQMLINEGQLDEKRIIGRKTM